MQWPAEVLLSLSAIALFSTVLFPCLRQLYADAANVSTHPPGDVRVLEGDEASFACASEDPLVTRLEWRFVNQTNFDLWPFSIGGRVFFQRVFHNYSGVYECRAFTGSYPLGLARLTLSVLRPLKVEKFQMWTGKDRAVLTCKVTSDAPIVSAVWLWMESPIDGYDVFSPRNESDNRFTLVVDASSSWTEGKFTCLIGNDFGQNATAEHSIPENPATPRVEMLDSADGDKLLRLRVKKDFCGQRIDLVYWPSSEVSMNPGALPVMTSMQCRGLNPLSSLKQLVSGFVDIVISPKEQWGLRANSVYYAEATALDEVGNAGPPARFVFETGGDSSSMSVASINRQLVAVAALLAVRSYTG